MVKNVYELKLKYQFDGSRKGAKYTVDGVHYMNAGEFLEIAIKDCKGFEMVKDANTAFNVGSDIEPLKASVKSSRATLTTCDLGNTFAEVWNNYKLQVASELFIWVIQLDETIISYEMNLNEFEQFTFEFAKLNERKHIRYKTSSSKMIKWFEDRL